MGRSRASKDQMQSDGCMPRRTKGDYSGGGYVADDHWIEHANVKKGALHSALNISPEMHIPEGQKISTKKLEKAEHSDSPLLRKRANLAMRYRGK